MDFTVEVDRKMSRIIEAEFCSLKHNLMLDLKKKITFKQLCIKVVNLARLIRIPIMKLHRTAEQQSLITLLCVQILPAKFMCYLDNFYRCYLFIER